MDDKNMSMKPEHPMGCQCSMCMSKQMRGCGCGNRSLIRCVVALVVLAVACCAAFQLGQLKGLMLYSHYDRGYGIMQGGRQMMRGDDVQPQNVMMRNDDVEPMMDQSTSTKMMQR